MSERSSDAHVDPSNPPEPAGGPELTPSQPVAAEQTWGDVLTGEEVDVPAGAAGNTAELVGAVVEQEPIVDSTDDREAAEEGAAEEAVLDEVDFLGLADGLGASETHFETTSAVTSEDAPAPDQDPAADLMEGEAVAAGEALAAEAVFDEGDDSSASDAEATQVLRRSLLATADHTDSDSELAATAASADAAMPSDSVVNTRPSVSTFEEAMSAPTPELSEEAETLPTLPGRALARTLSLILTLILTPIAWYLVADASARMAFAPGNPMLTGQINAAALAELFAGLVAIAIIALLAAQSSLGLIITGIVVMAVGVPFLVIPGMVSDTGYWGVTNVANWNAFGGNISNHFLTTGFTGIFFALGFLMVALGWVVAAVRRAGRQEEALRLVVAAQNPQGLKARWARKATKKGQVSQ